MLMDISSELIHSLLPVFMTTVLGASMATIGLLEGVAEGTAAVTKVFSGAISDYLGKRKLLAVLGYGLGAITKPIFPLAATIGWVFAARFIDRVGKGIRGAPRDALVADIAPPELRGAAYGLRQSLDSIGAFLGPLLAVAFMALLANDIRTVLWVAVAPAFLAVALLVVGVREPERAEARSAVRRPLLLTDARRLPLRYWLIVLLGAVFTLARFSEAFLVLRAQEVGLALGYVPMVLIAMNVVYAAVAYPAGIAADGFNRRTLIVVGLAMLVAADSVLAAAASPCGGVHRRGPLGAAHGAHARTVRKARGRHGPGRAARHRLRHLQRCRRLRALAGERHCGHPVERLRCTCHVPGRGGLRHTGTAWAARLRKKAVAGV